VLKKNEFFIPVSDTLFEHGVWGSMEQKTHVSLSLASGCLDSVAIKTEKPV
jgi:hypothetical protein